MVASDIHTSTTLGVYRPALDGVRAFAVIAVFAYHLGITQVPGGFLGVDLFFVLSGYLITGLLLDEHARSGAISLARFWTRRVRRLLPAVVVLLLALSAYCWFIALPEDNYGLRRDSIAALFYSANWWFIASGKSYFDQFSDVSPLRHTWSLSIEEQFYFVWPLAIAWLMRTRWSRKAVAMFAIIGGIASATAMDLLLNVDASRAYYGTDGRVHELLIGALAALAIRSPRLRLAERLSHRAWASITAVAFLMVLAAVLVVTDSTLWYYRGVAVAFSIASAALLLGLDLSSSPVRTLLSRRPVSALGRISYGVYLWHWPVIVLMPAGQLGRVPLMIVQVGVTLAVSILSYIVVERPIRRGAIGSFSLTPRRTAIAFGIAMASTASLLVASTANAEMPTWATKLPPGQFSVLGDTSPNAPTIAVVGDSIARSTLPGLDTAGKRAGVRIIGSAWSGCGIGVDHLMQMDGQSDFDYSAPCDKAIPEAYKTMVKRYHPQVIFWHSVLERFPFRQPDGTIVFPDTPEYETAVLANFRKSYLALTSGGAQVLIATVVLRAQRFKGTCKSRLTDKACGPDDGSDGIYAALNARSEEFVSTVAKAKMLDINLIICPGGAPCPTYVDGVMLRYDGSHLTAAGTQVVGPPLLNLIVKASGIKPLRPWHLSKHVPKRTATGKS